MGSIGWEGDDAGMAETEGVGPGIRAHCCQPPDIIFIFRRRVWDNTATRKVDLTDQKTSGHPRLSQPTFRVVCCSKHLLAAPLIARNIGAWKSSRVGIQSNLAKTPKIRTILGRHTRCWPLPWRSFAGGKCSAAELSKETGRGSWLSVWVCREISTPDHRNNLEYARAWIMAHTRRKSWIPMRRRRWKDGGREGRDGEGRGRRCFFGTSRTRKVVQGALSASSLAFERGAKWEMATNKSL
jgi:hypothetical protein